MSLNRFAHLLGFGAKASDEDEKKEKARRAEEEEQEEQAEEDEEEDKESDEVKKGRKAENKRCAAIFASHYAAGNVGMAAHLAFETRMSASEAIGVLKMAGASVQPASKIALDQRMQAVLRPQVGVDAPTAQDQSVAAKMMAVYNNVKGKK